MDVHSLWEVMSIEEAVAEVRSVSDPVLAAKRLQDLAQSYNCESSLSVIVLRFQNLSEDVDLLAKEMQLTMRSNRVMYLCLRPISSFLQ